MRYKLRLGVLGTGNIARQFCAGVKSSARADVTVVGSRSRDVAADFAAAQGVGRFGSYDDVLNAPDVDAVYVSLPNSMHHQWTIKALNAGKHVLCEKPIAVDEPQALEMFDAAKAAGRVLVEAFMYRCHPQTLAVQKAVAEGVIGAVRSVRTSFTFKSSKQGGNVRFDPALAGGSLMDVGCYCVNFARLFAGGEPTLVSGTAQRHSSGVDDGFAGLLGFDNGVVSTFTCGMSAHADNTAVISGTEGFIEVPVPWKPPSSRCSFSIATGTPPKMDGPAQSAGPRRETVTLEVPGDLYGVEADAFAAIILDGDTPWMTEADTLGNMRTLDRLRASAGLSWGNLDP